MSKWTKPCRSFFCPPKILYQFGFASGIQTRSQARGGVLRDVTNNANVAASGPLKPGFLSNRNGNNIQKSIGVKTFKKALPTDYTTATRGKSLRRPREGDDVTGRPSKLFKTGTKVERRIVDNKAARLEEIERKKNEILPVDKKLGDKNDLYPAEYTRDIYRMLQKTALKYPIDSEYMTCKQDEISAQMRAILIDWLVDLHRSFDMSAEALHLSVNLLDRYLSKAWVKRSELQLAGSAALLIACKYEDIYPPELSELEGMTAHTYTCQQIIDFEIRMLTVLDFHITVPTGLLYIDRFLTLFEVKPNTDAWRVAHYLMELGLSSYALIRHSPAKQAAAVLFIILRSNDLAPKLVDKNTWMTFLRDNLPSQLKIA